jgi:outer membrane receptor for ferrienterochelin and colicin
MASRISSLVSMVAALLLLVFAAVQTPAAADQPITATSEIRGVVTTQDGEPIGGADVTLYYPGGSKHSTTDGKGRFAFAGLSIGSYYIAVDKSGYARQISETVNINEVAAVQMDIKLESSEKLASLGHVLVRANRGLETSPVIYQVVQKASLDRLATFRLFDAIQSMPGLNAGQYNSAAPGDNAAINIRGIGTLETVTLIDGHPATISNSQCGCFEFNNAPTMSLKSVDVTYGSGAVGLYGVNAIGGVVDLQTIDPTVRPQSTLSLGVGSYANTVWSITETGTENRVGYAFNYGTRTSDGSLFHKRIYNPSAMPTTVDFANPANYGLATYPVDMGYQSRSALMKFRYSFTPQTEFTFTSLSNDTWDDKTGNGDNDFNPLDHVMAGNANRVGSDPACPNGINYPDPTLPNPPARCFSLQQYSSFFAGPQGGGPADQSFRLNDFHGNLSFFRGASTYAIDAYHGFYIRNYNRQFQLPQASGPFWFTEGAQQTGLQFSDDIVHGSNDLGIGYYVQHVQEARTRSTQDPITGAFLSATAASPYFVDANFFARDVITGSHLTTYLNAWVKRSQLTNTSHFDPRVTFVLRPDRNNVWRATFGGGITQPNPTDRYAAFAGVGAINPNCTGATNIGNGPGTTLIPETSSDAEVSYGHQTDSGSSVQLTVYRTSLFNQLFATSVNVASLGAGYVPANLLQAIDDRIKSVCGGSPPYPLSVNVTENLGKSLYRGIELSGTQAFSPQFKADYTYDVQSAMPVALDLNVYMNSPNIILNSQLPFIPIHKATLGLDYQTRGWDAYFQGNMVDQNNEQLLPRFYYANAALSKKIGNDTYTLSVQNLFNSWADSYGYFGHGYLPTNQFTPQSTNPLLNSYEQFHLPFRSYFFSVTQKFGG